MPSYMNEKASMFSQDDLLHLQQSITDHMTPRISKTVSDELKSEFRELFKEFSEGHQKQMSSLLSTVQRHETILHNLEGKVRHVVQEELVQAQVTVPDEVLADIEKTKTEMKRQGDELRKQRDEISAQNHH